MVTSPTSHVRSVTSSSGTSGIAPLYEAAAGHGLLVSIQSGDEQAHADGENGNAGGDFPRIFLRVRRGLPAAALQIVASGGEVLLDGDVLNRRLDLRDHVVVDAEFAKEILEPVP